MSTKLIQFLMAMGLNTEYWNVRSQILMQNPLQSVDTTYSMLLQIEKQRMVNMNTNDIFENNAMCREQFQRKYGDKGDKNDNKKLDKSNPFCDFCKAKGHMKDTCFKLHGYYEWFKMISEGRGKSGSKYTANMVEGSPDSSKSETLSAKDIKEIIKGEIANLSKNKKECNTNLAFHDDFTGDMVYDFVGSNSYAHAFNILDLLDRNNWIIDTSASNHMRCDLIL